MNDNARERWYQYAKENEHIDRETRWKQFYELNKDELDADYKKIDDMRKEKARNYYEEHKEEIRAKAKARYPTYYEKNKDKINEQRRNNPLVKARTSSYYYENKDKINADRNAKIECECGGTYSKRNQVWHKTQSKKHLKWLETKTSEETNDNIN